MIHIRCGEHPAYCRRSAVHGRFQLFGALGGDEGVDDLVKIAVHDLVELVESQSDAVIGQTALGEIVGADLFAAVAGAYLTAAVGGGRASLDGRRF